MTRERKNRGKREHKGDKREKKYGGIDLGETKKELLSEALLTGPEKLAPSAGNRKARNRDRETNKEREQ